jgi:hypothetical protein
VFFARLKSEAQREQCAALFSVSRLPRRWCVAKAHSRSMMAKFFTLTQLLLLFYFFFSSRPLRSRVKLFPLCVSADLHPKNFPASFFSLLTPALCRHDFFSNHLLVCFFDSSSLNSIRFATLQHSFDINYSCLPLN